MYIIEPLKSIKLRTAWILLFYYIHDSYTRIECIRTDDVDSVLGDKQFRKEVGGKIQSVVDISGTKTEIVANNLFSLMTH